MPEIKNSFLQGKMNKDLDERLVPNGQYRDAVNVEVSTAEGSGVGVVKNILGNHKVETLVGDGFKCVGSIADEKTNKIYWFVSKYLVDAIIEYDETNDIASAVLVDRNAGNYKAVLKFSGNIITGINIIDNLLFWTDNNSEPKKINIDECKKGTIQDGTLDNHTQLIFDNGSFNGITIGLISNHADNSFTSEKEGKYVWFEEKQLASLLGEDIDSLRDNNDLLEINRDIKHYRKAKFLGVVNMRIFSNTNGTHIRYETFTFSDFKLGDIIFGKDVKVDIEERHITVIKPKPLNALSVKINHTDSATSTSKIPNLFETKFPRFSYRYKYRD